MRDEMPKRPKQHVSETDSVKLFSQKIPSHWIIREVTERDYGIDCYVEIVDDNNQLTGHMFMCQLKSKESVTWNADDKHVIFSVKITTTNYWFNFQVPIFLFLTDIKAQEVYFIPVDHYIRQNYIEYRKQKDFSYTINKRDKFDKSSFESFFYREFHRLRFENEFRFFLSNVHHYNDFMDEHDNRDYHMCIDGIDLIFLESLYLNLEFLCQYFDILWDIETMDELKVKSHTKFGSDNCDFREHDVAELIKLLKPKMDKILVEIKDFIEIEKNYWMYENLSLFNFVINIGEDGELPNY